MSCGCGKARAGRGVVTSGDYQPPPSSEPLAVLDTDGDEPAPDAARYRVIVNGSTAYFAGYDEAAAWQGDNGGRLRIVS